jgi:hypothetical protein
MKGAISVSASSNGEVRYTISHCRPCLLIQRRVKLGSVVLFVLCPFFLYAVCDFGKILFRPFILLMSVLFLYLELSLHMCLKCRHVMYYTKDR